MSCLVDCDRPLGPALASPAFGEGPARVELAQSTPPGLDVPPLPMAERAPAEANLPFRRRPSGAFGSSVRRGDVADLGGNKLANQPRQASELAQLLAVAREHLLAHRPKIAQCPVCIESNPP